MPRSMTGFGRCFVEDARAAQQWEIRSVNGRYLDIKWRLPLMARYLEPALEKVVRKYARRGRLEISLSLHFAPENAPKAVFDATRAAGMLESLAEFARGRGDIFAPDYNHLLPLAALWGEPETDDMDDMASMLSRGLALALEDWNEARVAEGAQLARDLENRVLLMRKWLAIIDEAAPRIREERILLLRERVAQMLEDIVPDEDRLLQEFAILTDRLDVSEELTRLGAHLGRLLELLRDEDAGRKIDFTLQECFREINTCGNKTPDVDLSRLVVDFKNELEKCREQAQNLE